MHRGMYIADRNLKASSTAACGRIQVGQNVDALLAGIDNGWRPVLSIRLATPRPLSADTAVPEPPAPTGGFEAREERDLRGELGDMPQARTTRAVTSASVRSRASSPPARALNDPDLTAGRRSSVALLGSACTDLAGVCT